MHHQLPAHAMPALPAAQTIIDILFLLASMLFMLALRWMIAPHTARRGMRAWEVGMLLAIGGTLVPHGLVDDPWMAIALGLGAGISWRAMGPLVRIRMSAHLLRVRDGACRPLGRLPGILDALRQCESEHAPGQPYQYASHHGQP
jgi:hypothetical protein